MLSWVIPMGAFTTSFSKSISDFGRVWVVLKRTESLCGLVFGSTAAPAYLLTDLAGLWLADVLRVVFVGT